MRLSPFTTRTALAICACFVLPCSSLLAEQTVDLELQPVKSGQKAASSQTPASRQNIKLPSRGLLGPGASGKQVGRVGYVQAAQTTIRKSRSAGARALFSVAKGTPLAVIDTSGSWYGVLMVDGSTGWVPTSDLNISELRLVADTSSAPDTSSSLIRYAMSFMGTPYVWGGASRSGTDCSGFVKQVWSAYGGRLPRTAREQALVGEPVAPENLVAGDRLYFACKGGAVDHTGIYVGNGMFIHSSSSRGGVALEQLSSGKYWSSLVVCRRG